MGYSLPMGDGSLTDVLALLGAVDADIVLFRPVLGAVETVVVDAEVVWASDGAKALWGEAPGALASEVLADFGSWIGAVSVAWRGVSMRHVVGSGPVGDGEASGAVAIIRRTGDFLSQVTLDRSSDQELLARVGEIESEYQTLLEQLPITIISSSAGRGSLEFVSRNAEQLTGRPLSQLRRFADWVNVVDPEDLQIANKVRDLLWEDGAFETPGRILHTDGEYRYVQFRMVSRSVGPHEPRRILVTLLDTTEQRRLQEQAAESERLAGLTRTAGAFGHEFSSLLQIITGHLDTIERAKSPESVAKAIGAVREAAGRASGLVGGLVAFASGRPGQLEPVSIPEMCEVTRPMLRERLPERIELAIDLAEGLPLVLVAPTAMRQIMFQLVDNAAESIAGDGRVLITVREQPHAACHLNDGPGPGCWVSIRVADTGSGIERSRLGYVWEPFHTTHTGSDARGRGLGLSVVHGAVHQYDGHVTLESHVGEGTAVTVYLRGVADPAS